MKRRRCGVALLVLGFVLIAGSTAFAQEDGWDIPDDYVPPASVPAAPPLPLLPVGPVLFDEAEFPFNGNVDGFVTNTLAGAPLDGPLGFAAPAGATFSDGPGATTLFVPPGVVGQAAQPLVIDFGVDVSEVSFVFNLGGPMAMCVAGGVDVTAFDSGMAVVGMTSVAGADMGFFFLEGQVGFSPGVFRSVQIDVTGQPGCDRYAIDFLAWDTVAMAPAMGTLWLVALAAALVSIGIWFARRREPA